MDARQTMPSTSGTGSETAARGRGRRRRRGRVPGRSRGRARGTGRGATLGARGRIDATQGWRISTTDTSTTLVLEEKFADKVIGARARLFWLPAVSKMREARVVKDLGASRGNFMSLFTDELLQKCMQWTNERIVLHDLPVERLKMWDMYRFLSVMLLSHTTGLSLEKTITILRRFATTPPLLERVRFIASNIRAFSAMGRGGTKESE